MASQDNEQDCRPRFQASRHTAPRWARFASVGVLGFGVQLAVLQILSGYASFPYPVAVVVAVEAAILHNFVWHARWTWRDRFATPVASPIGMLARFNAWSGAISLGGNGVFTAVFVELLALPVLVANALAVLCLTSLNFVVADRLAFSDRGFWRPQPRSAVAMMMAMSVAVSLLTPAVAHAGPTPATQAAWGQYVARVEARRAREQQDRDRFLASDFAVAHPPTLASRLARGEIAIDNVAGRVIDAGDGSISHWRGAALVRGVTLDDMLEVAAVRGPRVYYPKEDVLDHRVISREGDSLRLFLKLQRKAIVTAAYNTEHLIRIERLGATRASSSSVSTRIAELEEVGTSRERERSPDDDRGFLWRLHSYWRYQAVDGGVVVELESVTLSRNVPWALRGLAGPIIDRIARDSVRRTLAALGVMSGVGRISPGQSADDHALFFSDEVEHRVFAQGIFRAGGKGLGEPHTVRRAPRYPGRSGEAVQSGGSWPAGDAADALKKGVLS